MHCNIRWQYFASVIGFVLLFTTGSLAQPSTFNGWIFLNHEQKLNKRWSILSDIQFRSSNQLKAAETILIRPAVQYSFSEAHSVAVGYTYFANWDHNGEKIFDLEHRSWQQYNVKLKINNTDLVNRLRLEQRFLNAGEGYNFSQRLRYYVRSQIPLVRTKDFKHGAFVALQNELFLNIQNKKFANDRVFDQNRTYGSFGYRFNKKIDIELGYLYRYLVDEEPEHNHILQVVFGTTF